MTKGSKKWKNAKSKSGKPQLRVYALFVAIERKGCGLIRVSRLRICDYEDKLPLYLIKSEGFKGFLIKWKKKE